MAKWQEEMNFWVWQGDTLIRKASVGSMDDKPDERVLAVWNPNDHEGEVRTLEKVWGRYLQAGVKLVTPRNDRRPARGRGKGQKTGCSRHRDAKGRYLMVGASASNRALQRAERVLLDKGCQVRVCFQECDACGKIGVAFMVKGPHDFESHRRLKKRLQPLLPRGTKRVPIWPWEK